MSWRKKLPKAWTKPERVLADALRKANVSFVTQESISTPFREWPFIVDFYFPEHKLVVEVNGRYWHDRTKRQRKKTEIKEACLEQAGYKFLAFWDDEVLKAPDLLVEAIKAKFASD